MRAVETIAVHSLTFERTIVRTAFLNLALELPHLLQYIHEQDSYSYAVAAVCGQTDHGGRESGYRRRSDERPGGAASRPEKTSLHGRRETTGLRQPLRQR